MSFQPKTGQKMKAYRNTGTAAAPTWVEVSEIGDVSISDFKRILAQLKRRAKDFTKNLPAMLDSIGIDIRLLWGLGATNHTAIRTAFLAGTTEEWAIMSGTITDSGEQGLRLPIIIEDFPWDQNQEEASGHDLRLAIAYHESPAGTEIDPSWMVVA